jgi:Domain of unknown function (DUF397)
MTIIGEWRTSTHSGTPSDPACVEVAPLVEGVAVRDSKNRGGHVLTASARGWEVLMASIKAGAFV